MKNYLFIDQSIEKLKKDIFDSKKRFFIRLDDQCKRYHNMQLSEEHPNGSSTYMGIAIANLALAYILTEQKHYLEEARRFMNTVVGYDHWGNAHLVDVDLSAAWLLFGLSLGYDWLKEVLPDEEVVSIKDKLLLQSRRMYKFKIETEGEGWSTNFWQNHNWINLTGLASAGYALVDLGEEPLSWVTCAKDNFDFVYKHMPEDGSDYEGVVYWRYGAMWLFIYAHLLKEREKIDYFLSTPFLKNTFYYRLYQSAPNLEEQINFGDCHDRYSGHSTAIYYKTAAEYKNGYAQYMGDFVVNNHLYREAFESQVKPGILPECFFELLFYDDSVQPQSFEDLPTKKYFEDLGLLVIRDSWQEDALHFSFKCGAPGGETQWEKLWELKTHKNYNCFGLSHQHPDNNSFILHAHGVYLAIDDGYNRSVKASDHNMILVDGLGFEDEGQNNVFKNYTKDMRGKMEVVRIEDDFVYAVGETAACYKKELAMNHCQRHILYHESGYILIYDYIESSLPHTYSWLMHADNFPENVENKENNLLRADYKNGTGALMLFQKTTNTITFDQHINTVRAVMTTQEPDKFRETHMKTLSVSTVDKINSTSFITVLKPYSSNCVVDIEVEDISNSDMNGILISTESNRMSFIVPSDGSTPYFELDDSNNNKRVVKLC